MKNILKKLGISSWEDWLYATATCLIAIYILSIWVFTLMDIIGKHLDYSSRFILFDANIQFSYLLLLCIVIMYGSVFIWIFMGFASFFYRKKPDKIKTSETIPVVVLIPAHNEEGVIKNILFDLLNQHYKKMEIVVVAHNCTDKTAEIARSVLDSRIHILEFNSIASGKALALNYGLKYIIGNKLGEVIAQFDTDNRFHDPLLFNRALSYFDDQNVDVIQGTLYTSNTYDSLLSFLQEVEYNVFSCISWQGRDALKLPCFLAGTGIFIRTSILEEVDGWSNSLVEDFELFTRLTLRKKKIIYADNVVIYDEKPITWSAVMKQRSRWVKGHLCVTRDNIHKFGNWLDYLYRLSPLAVYAWWISNFIYIYYFLTGQMSVLNVSGVIWVGWSLLFLLFMIATTWKKRGFKRTLVLPIYWLFGFHWMLVSLYALGVRSWEETKTVHHGSENGGEQ